MKNYLSLFLLVFAISCIQGIKEDESSYDIKTASTYYITNSVAGSSEDNLSALLPIEATVSVFPQSVEDRRVGLTIHYKFSDTYCDFVFRDIKVQGTDAGIDQKGGAAQVSFENIAESLDYTDVSIKGALSPISLYCEGLLKGQRFILHVKSADTTPSTSGSVIVDYLTVFDLCFENKLDEDISVSLASSSSPERYQTINLSIHKGEQKTVRGNEAYWARGGYDQVCFTTASGKSLIMPIDPEKPQGINLPYTASRDFFIETGGHEIYPAPYKIFTFSLTEDIFRQ